MLNHLRIVCDNLPSNLTYSDLRNILLSDLKDHNISWNQCKCNRFSEILSINSIRQNSCCPIDMCFKIKLTIVFHIIQTQQFWLTIYYNYGQTIIFFLSLLLKIQSCRATSPTLFFVDIYRCHYVNVRSRIYWNILLRRPTRWGSISRTHQDSSI